ncbi:Hypothetical predicted protein [Octopus vulgaris]|uniref:Uncharacterized protein n=1 Tax=Octopus vulgaris TaxID=6645 RepID=A0AA36HH75_OCTVU|nr:Hypothetical predicted protein [Octopus vulgaris]
MDDLERAACLQRQTERHQDGVASMNAEQALRLRDEQVQRKREGRHGLPLNRHNNPKRTYRIGDMYLYCEYCGALNFKYENFMFCHNNKVNFPPLQLNLRH